MKLIIALCALVAAFIKVEATNICKTDDMCKDLGSLYCLKGQCEQGICGCHRGSVAKYLGSERLFACVPLKKVNEKCSTDWDAGVCGAPNSYCWQGYCKCTSGVSIWGGEYCASTSQVRTVGESCSGSVGSCSIGNDAGCYGNSQLQDELNYAPRSCSCLSNQKLSLPNHVNTNDFIGKKAPYCVSRVIGDYCFKNNQCPTGAECVNEACACVTATSTQDDAMGSSCSSATALGVSAICAGTGFTTGRCNGASGLTCGDPCDLTDPTGITTSIKKCAYDTMTSSGKAASVGSSCFGDHNCQSLGNFGNGICVDSKCQNAGVQVAMSLSALLCIVLAALMFQ